MNLGIIADDFTGATDVAGFLVAEGVRTALLVGVPEEDAAVDASAVVISLKSRACPAQQAVADSLEAMAWLKKRGARQIYQKYCSTFDSTAAGNIGPVADALLDALGDDFTVVCPALPVNGRSIYNGYLFVDDVLLEESGMRDHPVNPMTDSRLTRLMEMQASGRAGLVAFDTVERGSAAIRQRLQELQSEGARYAVLDALTGAHLDVLAQSVQDLPLVTGGSGLAASLARTWSGRVLPETAASAGRPGVGPGVVLSGSCSGTTRGQVAAYARKAPWRSVDVDRCIENGGYAQELARWVVEASNGGWVPMVYATTDPESLRQIQSRHGPAAGEAVEATMAAVARILAGEGFVRFIVAGGETAGAVVQALNVTGFHVGPQIAPGVPWVRAIDKPYSMALKSGNFGTESFFTVCQRGFERGEDAL